MNTKPKPPELIFISILGLFSGGTGIIITALANLVMGSQQMLVDQRTGACILMLVSLTLVLSARGLWLMKRWGKNLTIGLYLFMIPYSLISIHIHHPSTALSLAFEQALNLVGIVISLFVIQYLWKPQVSQLFH
ncbi:DUF2127 domain-containing protein [Vibrio sp. S4M6]|uniref:DUF2127 domain-containing protein n=1 Tax=Vibrio sinus TaxID=2946865 RepID=UPI00202A3F2F|nr:DUF2127 domain-containing protein [Vibrio sinus]